MRSARSRSRPARLARGALALLTAALAGSAVIAVLSSAHAASNGTYEDSFPTAGSFSESTGSLVWAGPWSEIGESDGAGVGRVSVGSWLQRCSTGDCLRINDDTAGTSFGASRTADLSGAGTAVLTFSYALEQDNPGGTTFTLDIASSPTGPWTTLATYDVTGSVAAPVPQGFDVTPYIGSGTTIRVLSDGSGLSDEIYLDDVRIQAVPASAANPKLFFSIKDDTSTGPTGITSLKDGAIAQFGPPGVHYEPGTTAGTLTTVASWDAIFGAGGLDLNGLHLVGTAITVGGAVGLQPGDLLFSLQADGTLTGTNGPVFFRKSDVGRFRPASPGNYESGSFAVVLDNPLGAEVRGITLVEQATKVGEVTLPAGAFLMTRSGGAEDDDIWEFVATSAGAGSTSGTVTRLLQGEDFGFSNQLWGVDLVETGYGWPFPKGAIVVTTDKDALISGTAVSRYSLISLLVGRTSVSGTATVEAVEAWEGGDLGFNEDKERLDAFSFASLDVPPTFSQNLGDRTDAEGSSVSISAGATDPLGDPLTYSATGLPPGVSINTSTGLIAGTIGYTAAAASPYSVTLTVSDPGENTDVDTFTWTVTNVNRAPTTTAPPSQSNAEGDVVSVTVPGSDPDGDTLTWTATGLPGGLSIASGTGVISGTIAYTASPGSPYTVTVRATDNGSPSLYSESTFTWSVTDINRAPTVTNPGAQTDVEGSTVNLAISGSDPDGDAVAWTATGLPTGVSIDASSGLISGTLPYDAAAGSPYGVVVRATDDGSPSAYTEVSFTWTVTNLNRAPSVTSPGDRTNSEGDVVAFGVSGSDPDSDTLIWSASGLPPGLSIASASGVISGTVGFDASAASPYTATVRATDNGSPNLFSEVTFTWTVDDTNRPPAFAAPLGDRSDDEGTSVVLVVAAADPDADSLRYSAVGLPPGIAIHPTNGTLVGTIDYTAAAGSPYSVTLRVEDPSGLFDEQSLVWTVADVSVPLQIGKSSDATGPVRPGDALEYTVTITNASTVIHRGVSVSDPVPPGTGYFPGSATVVREGAAVDTFETGDYTGSSGPVPWAGPWQEAGDTGSSASGVAVVEADAHCRQTACLRLGGDGVTLDGVAVSRSVDLSGASAPRLTLSYLKVLLGASGGSVAIQARGNGAGWTTLATIDLNGSGNWGIIDVDLAPYAAEDTQIRFLGAGSGVQSVVSFDDVRVATASTVALAGSPPPSLVSGVDVWPGETITIDYLVVLDDPNVETQLTNTATVTSEQFTVGAIASVVDFVDQPPAFDAAPSNRSDAEGAVIAFAITATDPEGGAVTYAATGLPPGVAMNAGNGVISGTLTYAASPSSPYTVVVTITDQAGLSDSASFQWTVADTNRPPDVTNPGGLTAAEGNPVTLAIAGSDPDGDGLTWTATGLPGGLSINPASGVVSGTVSYSAAASSPFSVTVRASDNGTPSRFGEVSFTWTITNTNRAPVVSSPGPQSGAEGTPVSLGVNGTDPDGNSLTWTATGLPSGLAIDPVTGVVGGTLSYTASPGSPYSVTVRATDNGSPVLFGETTFTWTVSNTNRAPVVAGPTNRASAEGAVVSLPISGSDPDGDTLTWSATGLPQGLTIGSSTGVIAGTVSYTASSGSPYTVTVRATDSGSPTLFSEATFTWTVSDTNRNPRVTNPGQRSTAEGQAVSLSVAGSDPDGDILTWSATGLPASLTIDPATGVISGSIGFASAGSSTVVVRATDDGTPALFSEVSFGWVVADTNRAPTLQNPGSRTDAEGDTVAFQVVASDPDGDGVSFTADGLPPGIAIDPSSGAITGSLGYSLADAYTVTLTVSDDGDPSLTSSVSFRWTVGDTNRAPSLGILVDRSTEMGESASVTPSATDPDGDQLSWSATGLPPGISISSSSGVISGAATAPGAFTVTVTVTDDGTPPASTSATFTWLIVSPPGFPVVEAVPTQTNHVGDTVSLTVRGSHPDGLAIEYAATGLPDGLTIDAHSGTISGVTAAAGSSFVVVSVTDSRGQRTSAGFLWTVLEIVDQPPEVTDDSVSVASDTIMAGGIVLDATGNDHDPEGLAVTLVSAGPADIGEVSIVDGLVVFMPPPNWIGTVTFPYTVADPPGNTATGTITITVEEPLSVRLGTGALAIDPATPRSQSLAELGRLDPSVSTEVLLGTVFQSLYVLRVPLALLGGAVFWSLLLGGLLNLGFVFRGGIPRFVRRTSSAVAVVMVPHGGKVEVLEQPGGGAVLGRLLATDRGLEALRREEIDGEEWVQISFDDRRGWVRGFNLTEEVDRSWFADDPEPPAVVKEFVARLRARQDFTDLVSAHGLFVSHHAPIIHFPREILPQVMESSVSHVWKGRNPAYPDFSGSFDLAVATTVLDAFDHPFRELLPDMTAVPSTVIPVEFSNYHFIAIGADVHGAERLDQSAWLVVFSYEASRPKIIGLVKEG